MTKIVELCMIMFNDEAIITDCLQSVRSQDYPQDLVRISIIDGGSTDRSVEIARSFGADVEVRPDLRDSPNVRAGMVLGRCTGDLVLGFSADNRFVQTGALSAMVQTIESTGAAGCSTFRFGYAQTDPVLSRYFALIGGGDPVAVGLGRADRAPWDVSKWHAAGRCEDHVNFFLVDFSEAVSRDIPTLGWNGFLLRGDLVRRSRFAKTAAHIDLCVDLIAQGYAKFAFLKRETVNHYVKTPLLAFVRRRIFYANMYSGRDIERIYHVYERSLLPRLLWLIVTSVTLGVPIIRSVRGFVRTRDLAWFLHPLMLNIFIFAYAQSVIKNALRRS
jgi:glycosyltransferase involved in cell wall biosynthesis